MSTTTSIARLTVTAAAVGALAIAGAAGAAEAPVVSEQGSLAAERAPVTFPGTGVRKGERMPAGARIVFRDVTLEGNQRARLTLRAAPSRTLRGLGVREGQAVGFTPVTRGRYVGRRRVIVRANLPQADGEVTGRLYALTR